MYETVYPSSGLGYSKIHKFCSSTIYFKQNISISALVHANIEQLGYSFIHKCNL